MSLAYVKGSRRLDPIPKALPLLDTTAPIRCAPIASNPVDPAAALEIALRLKALADPVRVLKALREAGLIIGERRGTWIYYSPVREALGALARVLDPACC